MHKYGHIQKGFCYIFKLFGFETEGPTQWKLNTNKDSGKSTPSQKYHITPPLRLLKAKIPR